MELPSRLFSVLHTVTDLSLEVPDAHVALLSSSGSTVWRDLLPSSADFFTMLQTASSLRHLRLVHYIPDIAHGLTSEVRMAPVVLSHLEDFHLVGFGSNCVYVLQRVLFPSTKHIHISASQTQTIGVSDTYLEPLFSSVTQLTRAPSALRIRSLFIRPQFIDGRRYMRVDAWEDSGLELTDTTVRPWPRHLLSPTTVSLSVQYSSHRPSFTYIFDLLHLDDLRNLTIIIRPYGAMSKNLWKENIGPFRTLQHISVRGDTAISFFYALSETTSAVIESSDGGEANDLHSLTSNGTLPTSEENIFLPNLTSIDIREVDFNEDMDDLGTSLLIALPHILMRRKAIGEPITRLSVLRCILRRDSFHFLHNLVANLEWDGVEDGVQGEFDDSHE